MTGTCLTPHVQSKLDQLSGILRKDDGLIEGFEFAVKELSRTKPNGKERVTEDQAAAGLLRYVQRGLLDHGLYAEAARVMWGEDVFNVKPESVQRIWRHLPNTAEMLIMGAASMGKSYSVAVWLLLDWLRDPMYTCIKVLSVTEEHAKRNVFAHVKNLHGNSLIPLPGIVKDASIQIGTDDKQGIHRVAIPSGDEGKGRLRGFHPVPRGNIHPQFGSLSRVRAILDEAEEIPSGVWEDVDNMLSTKDGVEQVKVIGATNPKDRNSRFGQRCEPKDGWQSLDIESASEWTSRLGWQVVRVDGARCENVAERKIVFPGLLTWEGYKGFLALGDTSPTFFTMARGWFPDQGLHTNIIPGDFIDRARGMFLFYGAATYVASVDLAFEGGDKAVMTIGRWGTVISYQNQAGVETKLDKPRHGLQVESQFELAKTHTLDMARQIKQTCDNLHIGPEWLIVDRTGNGTGVHDALKVQMGEKVMGLNFGEASTRNKVLEDDTQFADELYDGVVTELFFSARKFMEFHILKFAPPLRMDSLASELTNRRFKQVKQGRVRVESKKEYKSRGNNSPDHADSLTMLVHLVRMRSEFTAQMLAIGPQRAIKPAQPGIVDNLEFLNFNDENKE